MGKRGVLLVMLAALFMQQGCMTGKSCDFMGQASHSQEPKSQGRLQDQGDGTCLDLTTGKLWQVTRSNKIKALESADQYIQELRLAGHDDWRLPTLAELYELFLLFDHQVHGDCSMDFGGNYWSGDVDQKGRVGAWELDADCHPEREYVPKNAGYVRAVRP